MTKLRGAIMGFGQIAEKGHWPTYAASSEADILAVMDVSPHRRAVAQALRPGLRTYGSVDDLFQAEKLDFVDICTPPSSHAAMALAALEQDCHVLCEKPLTLKLEDYHHLAEAMVRVKKTVFTVHNWTYAPIIQKALALIQDGRIGSVWHVEMFTMRSNRCEGSSTEKQSLNWRRRASIAGGGILIDHGWHSFYLLLHLVQAKPEKILATMAKGSEETDNLEEVVQALVQFPHASAYIHLTWRASTRRNHVVIQGQKGTLVIDDHRLLLTDYQGTQEEIPFDEALSEGSHHPDWFARLWDEFRDEVRDPARRGINFQESGWCLAMTTGAYESHLQGFKEIRITLPTARTPVAR